MWTTPTFSTPIVSQEEFNFFHAIDRKLYSVLVMSLWRDPVECMQVMALWLWLENKGFGQFVLNIEPLPHTLAYHLADEAVTCLNCVNEDQFNFLSEISDIPLTQSLAEKHISLHYFVENRQSVAQGIKTIMNDVCARAFSDIMQLALNRDMNLKIEQSLASHVFPNAGFGPCPNANELPPDRTLFITFSRGYPVFEGEIREFFSQIYGPCIEYILMPERRPNGQLLYARIIVGSAKMVELILNGLEKAKFIINGKHVWARKYMPKDSRLSSVTPPPSVKPAPSHPSVTPAPPPPSVTPAPPESSSGD